MEILEVNGEELWVGRFNCPLCDYTSKIKYEMLAILGLTIDDDRFKAVRVLSIIIKVVAWIICAASVIIGFVAITNNDALAGIGIFLLGAIILIINLAIAELLLVLLAIEENTRKVPMRKPHSLDT